MEWLTQQDAMNRGPGVGAGAGAGSMAGAGARAGWGYMVAAVLWAVVLVPPPPSPYADVVNVFFTFNLMFSDGGCAIMAGAKL